MSKDERRLYERYPASYKIDYCNGDTFLYSYISNISEMGIFIRSDEPLPEGTELDLRFELNTGEIVSLKGEVAWINPVRDDGENLNPGMGVRFTELTPDLRETVVELVHTIAYLQDNAPPVMRDRSLN